MLSLTTRASLVGAQAQGLLTQSRFSGKVLAVCSSAIYLSSVDGEIVWIAWGRAPLHRRCIAVAIQPRSVQIGQCLRVQDRQLSIGPDVVIDFSDAGLWQPRGIESRWILPLGLVKARVLGLIAATDLPSPSDGFRGAISMLDAIAHEKHLPVLPPTVWTARATPTLTKIARACLEQDMDRLVCLGEDLVGLGPGLTPSGDDFIGGLLFAAHHLQRVYPRQFCWNQGIVEKLLDRARTSTHRISYAILNDLAYGHGPEPLHELVISLLTVEREDVIADHIQRLITIGHSSGWDMLAGLLAGMLLAVGRGGEAIRENPAFLSCR